MNEPFKVVISGGEAEVELKKSRFIAHVEPVESEEEATAFINRMKKQYYDARHNCYAYVIGKDGDRVKYSDDGEPAQTGGFPIYNVLKETGVRNVCIVVTRYFGGTLLGAGPLARMYSDAAKEGLGASRVGLMKFGIEACITSDYSLSEKIKYYLAKESVTLVDIKYENEVSHYIRAGVEQYEKISKDIISLTASKAKTEKNGEAWYIE